jgi:hypothetical protein
LTVAIHLFGLTSQDRLNSSPGLISVIHSSLLFLKQWVAFERSMGLIIANHCQRLQETEDDSIYDKLLFAGDRGIWFYRVFHHFLASRHGKMIQQSLAQGWWLLTVRRNSVLKTMSIVLAPSNPTWW